MNWYALLLCIVSDDEILSSEDAFDSLKKLKIVRKNTLETLCKESGKFFITKENSKEMSKKMATMREAGMTYKQIGQRFDLSEKATFNRVVSVTGKRKTLVKSN